MRHRQSAAAIENATAAVRLFEASGDEMQRGRALWVIACAQDDLGRKAASERAADEALAIARRTGDRWGEASALNIRWRQHVDLAMRLRGLQQSLACYQAAGNVSPAISVEGFAEETNARRGWYRGRPVYDIASPIFDEVRMTLENGRVFRITAVLPGTAPAVTGTDFASGTGDLTNDVAIQASATTTATDQPACSRFRANSGSAAGGWSYCLRRAGSESRAKTSLIRFIWLSASGLSSGSWKWSGCRSRTRPL
jgi:hypothetical protein